MPSSSPLLETDRLIMRPHVRGDFDESFAMWSDPEVIRFIGGQPFSRGEVWARLMRYAGHWALLGFGYWVVRDKQRGRFLGEVGFADFQRQIEPPLEGTPEIGWALSPAAHGRGYATEAVRAALRWADAQWACRLRDTPETRPPPPSTLTAARSTPPAVRSGFPLHRNCARRAIAHILHGVPDIRCR